MYKLMEDPILEFSGEHRFLSNFAPVEIDWEWIVYSSVEHAFVASKTLDISERKIIAGLDTPGKAKRYGRALDLRPNWDLMKVDVMTKLVSFKFRQPLYAGKLAQTGDRYLIEGNGWGDKFWGQSPVGSNDGKNVLGKILMEIRELNKSEGL